MLLDTAQCRIFVSVWPGDIQLRVRYERLDYQILQAVLAELWTIAGDKQVEHFTRTALYPIAEALGLAPSS